MPMPAAIASRGLIEVDGLAVDNDLPVVRAINPRQDLAERALAGPVLAAERVARASRDIEADILQRLDAGEALADAPELDEGSACQAADFMQLQVFSVTSVNPQSLS